MGVAKFAQVRKAFDDHGGNFGGLWHSDVTF
jgi:hypothetical protein